MLIPARLRSAFSSLLFLTAVSLVAAQSQAAPPVGSKPDPKTIAEVDAGIGPCTADFTITDDAGQPVYAANIRVHIAYGFMNLHKFDLQVGTNADGKARFIGLPETTKQGLFFRASESDRQGSAFDDPSKTCKTQFTVVLRKNRLGGPE
ncbi:MAG: hypothetical protein WAL56_00330 [Candidatus Sulfotelmatobacter sp.]